MTTLTSFFARAGRIWRAGRAGRNGRGACVPATTSIPNNVAICGNNGARRLTVSRNASVVATGIAAGLTCARIGEKASASSTAIQRSAPPSLASESVAALAIKAPSSTGNSTPALGGSPESFNARTTRESSTAAFMSSIQFDISLSWRIFNAVFSSAANTRVVSSRTTIGSSLPTTTARRSRRSSNSISDFAASALSSHSATRNFGKISEAIDSNPSALTSALPSFFSCAFCFLIASRTAPSPPSSARSATARCSTGSDSSTAARWIRFGLRRLAIGRFGISGGAGNDLRSGRGARGSRTGRSARGSRGSRAGRSDRGSRGSRSGRSVRGPLFPRRGLSSRDFFASFSVTPTKGLSSMSCSNVAF